MLRPDGGAYGLHLVDGVGLWRVGMARERAAGAGGAGGSTGGEYLYEDVTGEVNRCALAAIERKEERARNQRGGSLTDSGECEEQLAADATGN